MDYHSPRRKVSPLALVGKIFLILGASFLGLGLLFGAYWLFSGHGNGNIVAFVLGLLALIFGGLGLLEIVAGLILRLLPTSESPAARVVSAYYAALANQDYARAFSYVNFSIGSPLGSMAGEHEFARQAQAHDAQNGRVLKYALSGVQANPGRRTYTLTVTRNGGAYRTRLRLAKFGDVWKIVGFDRF